MKDPTYIEIATIADDLLNRFVDKTYCSDLTTKDALEIAIEIVKLRNNE